MSSFFTTPASQRKRKRADTGHTHGSKQKGPVPTTNGRSQKRARADRDESISGSDLEDDISSQAASEAAEEHDTSESEHGDETAAERRLRLAERYLENIREEVDEPIGFDAADVDRDLIAERLKEDVAETKGRLYRRIASNLSLSQASCTAFRADTLSTTGVAVSGAFAYTVSKDMTLIKWELPAGQEDNPSKDGLERRRRPQRRRPKQLAYTKGNKNKATDTTYKGHVDQILAVAASQDGKFVVTGGRDRRLIVWDADDLSPIKVFTQHRDAVTGLAFRRGTNQLYSSSKDRTVKVWSLDELAYIETLFGHQDEVVDVATLAQERCVSVGARDRTARLWKVVEETQLVFRGGGGEKKGKAGQSGRPQFTEGSMDRVAMVDEDTFVTGSDNGSLSLWSIHKKKPVFTYPLAHGIDPPLPPEEASAEQDISQFVPPPPQPRWITALATVPYSDLILSGSWDGWIQAWKISDDKRKLEPLGPVGLLPGDNGADGRSVELDDSNQASNSESKLVRGVVNGIAVLEKGERGRQGISIVVGIGCENRLGRWFKVKGKNGALVLTVPVQELGDDPTGDGNDPSGVPSGQVVP